jgi:DNA-directed RNA polymerase subunit N (RpoN/RPB10)
MLYSTCPTCGYFLGQKTLEWETKQANICSNQKITEEEKSKLLQELLISLGLRRYCCRMRMISYKDIVQDILAPKD